MVHFYLITIKLMYMPVLLTLNLNLVLKVKAHFQKVNFSMCLNDKEVCVTVLMLVHDY